MAIRPQEPFVDQVALNHGVMMGRNRFDRDQSNRPPQNMAVRQLALDFLEYPEERQYIAQTHITSYNYIPYQSSYYPGESIVAPLSHALPFLPSNSTRIDYPICGQTSTS